jgi:AhpD family alkylhydroperoxidase
VDRRELAEFVERLNANPTESAEALRALWSERHERIPFVADFLARRPEAGTAFLLKAHDVLYDTRVLDRKTNELIASAVAAALRCDYCMHAHIEAARASGGTFDEILQALLIAGAICETSSFSHSFRVLQRIEDKRQRAKAEPA